MTEIESHQIPEQLIVIDGTWDQARALFRDIPQLHQLPQFKLAPASPGQYRIRREPTSTSLSTVEATVAALQILEPDTKGLAELLRAFDTMVEGQLAHPNANYDQPETRKAETLNVPRSLRCDPQSIVVAYGEPTPVDSRPEMGWSEYNRQKKKSTEILPVLWSAQRLGELSIEPVFTQTIQPSRPIAAKQLAHMGLTEADFESAVSVEQFRERWSQFLREDDLLVVPNERTLRLLRNCQARTSASYLALKSVNHDPHKEFSSLSEFLESVSAPSATIHHHSRAGQRLANSVRLVRHLRAQFAH